MRADHGEPPGDTSSTLLNRRNALKAGGLVALLFGSVGTASAAAQGQIGTSSRPLKKLYTEELNGGITGNTSLTSLTGDRLSITSGALTADSAGISDSGTAVYANAADINFGHGLQVTDDGNGAVTVTTTLHTPRAVAFVDPSDRTPRRLNTVGTVNDNGISEQVYFIGPPTTDLTDDQSPDVPIATGTSNIAIVGVSGTVTTLDNSGNHSSGSLGVGDWNDDGTAEVVYWRDDTGTHNLYSVAVGRSPTKLGFTPRTGAAVADFDGDGSREIIWGEYDGTNVNLVYSTDGSTKQKTGYTGFYDMSIPADYDDDGAIEIPVAAGGSIDLVTADGTVDTYTPSHDPIESMGALDHTNTGVPDIIHLNYDTYNSDNNTADFYYYDVVADITGPVTDDSGTTRRTLKRSGIR